jgi:prophage regulatory protein
MLGRMNANETHTDRIVREPEVQARTGLSRSTRWRLARQGKFPKSVRIAQRLIGIRESELIAWIQSRQTKAFDEC